MALALALALVSGAISRLGASDDKRSKARRAADSYFAGAMRRKKKGRGRVYLQDVFR